MKFAPHWTAASMDIVLSCIACPSGIFDDVNAPEHRSGSFRRRASCPMTSEPSAGSGVPNVGDPERSAFEDRKLPKITGAPGRSSWVSAHPTIVSASAWATAPALVTGPIAPPRMNGTTTAHWFARA
jgi:hypothetical protein